MLSLIAIKELMILAIILLALQLIPSKSLHAEPIMTNAHFTVERIFKGHFEPSSMTFLSLDDILVLDRDAGKVYRITDGVESKPLLDVKVATDGYRGLLGIAATHNDKKSTNVFLYFTEARTRDGDDEGKNKANPLGNRIYRYDLLDNKLVNPRMLLDLPTMPGPRHAGGVLAIGPDKNIYLTIGDLDGTFRNKQYETKAQNYQNGAIPDGRSGILVVAQDGKPTGKQVLGNSFPLNLYYAYGIRNSFGIDWDPLTGYLWDSENGPNFGDELNLVQAGFNSGWAGVQGYWKPEIEEMGQFDLKPADLVRFNGRGTYSQPEFTWINPVAPSAIKFLDSSRYGPEYKNDLLVGDAKYGNIYDFNLDEQRMNLDLSGKLSDKTASNTGELKDLIFANGFGRITDMEIGPEGYLYVLSSEDEGGAIYKITEK